MMRWSPGVIRGELLFWEEEKPVGKMQILAAGVLSDCWCASGC